VPAYTRSSSTPPAVELHRQSFCRQGRLEPEHLGSLAILARRHRDLAEEALAEELPWLTWLPVEERKIDEP
jgi:hypothetical protein